jgi:hypothetical protein
LFTIFCAPEAVRKVENRLKKPRNTIDIDEFVVEVINNRGTLLQGREREGKVTR